VRREVGVSGQSALSQVHVDDIDLIVRRYEDALRRFVISRIGRVGDVDDLVQEVFVRFARREPGQVIERLEAYLFQAANNLIRDRARRQQVRRVFVNEVEDASRPVQPHSPEQLLIDRETLAQVRQALADLPERTRHVFLLYRVDGLRHQDIAEALSMSVSTVEKDVRRAMAHLTRRVRRP
jgi:RNA polymerase sigma factor (sigma-70 family)